MRKLLVTRAPETGWGCLTPSIFRGKPFMAKTTYLPCLFKGPATHVEAFAAEEVG